MNFSWARTLSLLRLSFKNGSAAGPIKFRIGYLLPLKYRHVRRDAVKEILGKRRVWTRALSYIMLAVRMLEVRIGRGI